MADNFIEDAIRERQPRVDRRDIDMERVWNAVRGSPNDLPGLGLMVAPTPVTVDA